MYRMSPACTPTTETGPRPPRPGIIIIIIISSSSSSLVIVIIAVAITVPHGHALRGDGRWPHLHVQRPRGQQNREAVRQVPLRRLQRGLLTIHIITITINVHC